jgi:hypothetical protein
MAKNAPYGDNRRQGEARGRAFCHDRKYTSFLSFPQSLSGNPDYRRFIDQKADKEPFKGVRKEK